MTIKTLLAGLMAVGLSLPTTSAVAQSPTQSRLGAANPPQLYRPVKCDERKVYQGRPAYSLPFSSKAQFDPMFSNRLANSAPLSKAFAEAKDISKAKNLNVALAYPGGTLWEESSAQKGQLFYWASATKTYTAVAVLQLVDEGKLSLADRLSRWEPSLPNADHITIRDLLAHTSGLFSANEDPDWREKGRRQMTPKQHDDILKKRGAMFCPGQFWRYSNSGYTLLGRIIERVEGKPFADVLQARVIDKLGLKETIVVTPENVSRVVPLETDGDEAVLDITGPGAAGPVAASAGDMARFWAALLSDRLVSSSMRDAMFNTMVPMADITTYYGLGVMLVDTPIAGGRLVMLGHGGDAPGVNAWVGYDIKRQRIVSAAMTGDGSAAAVANYMLRASD
ncbi:serine hydrolase domain-containing protein [Alterisphingorhabdus coralli]|uniref:Serine hydrolase domain-containing protein n=1 Tax=Alterisphingorhabdus coralli TaxID=3071408 RepID=A0AA97FAX3_9SPHN|nr:serine hydrolase domain-containing protein [Parasphingorhabdus sp. SCSIO 66989]WOE76418.1 serine hydrolase domain-containing protein [Parasphingorhabdus sp. SCSIO 66989]